MNGPSMSFDKYVYKASHLELIRLFLIFFPAIYSYISYSNITKKLFSSIHLHLYMK